MAKIKVLLEIEPPHADEPEGFGAFVAAATSETVAFDQAAQAFDLVAGLGVEPDENFVVVPMFGTVRGDEETADEPLRALREFSVPETNADLAPTSVVVPVEVAPTRLAELREREGVTVWENSPLHLVDTDDRGHVEPEPDVEASAIDLARSRAGVDCRPVFRPGATVDTIRELLGVARPWQDGFRGQNVVVAIIDEGVNGQVYPVTGGFVRPGFQPGVAPIRSHGSMCAADILVAAPSARLFDYPFLGRPDSGGALTMFQAVLEHRRLDGTPHLTNNSYGFISVPRKQDAPLSEIWNINHPLHRKVREVVASGAAAFFAAGNCGAQCPADKCHRSSIGPGRSIHGSNSLAEVITVAAVNSRQERIGYSSQGPGMFESEKPDLASYSHLFGNFGVGRPGGTPPAFDNGTSAATPVAAGVGALLLSAFPGLTPTELREALLAGLVNITGKAWDPGYGRGILNAAASYSFLLRKP